MEDYEESADAEEDDDEEDDEDDDQDDEDEDEGDEDEDEDDGTGGETGEEGDDVQMANGHKKGACDGSQKLSKPNSLVEASSIAQICPQVCLCSRLIDFRTL